MPSRRLELVAQSVTFEYSLAQLPGALPKALVDAILESDSSDRKLPRAVVIEDDQVVVYEACKTVSVEDLTRLEDLADCVIGLNEIDGLAGKEIHKVILAVSCDRDICLKAHGHGIKVVTIEELMERRAAPIG